LIRPRGVQELEPKIINYCCLPLSPPPEEYSSPPPTLETDSSSTLIDLVVKFTGLVTAGTISGTGSGSAVDYSSIGATAISNLESATSLSLNVGSNFDNITVSAVPEPSSYAMIFGGFALFNTLLRRPPRLAP